MIVSDLNALDENISGKFDDVIVLDCESFKEKDYRIFSSKINSF
jgi:hypothetical protein